MIQNMYYPNVNEYETAPVGESTCDVSYHYCSIQDLSRLVSAQISNKHGKKFICDRCLNYFSSKEKLHNPAIYIPLLLDKRSSYVICHL